MSASENTSVHGPVAPCVRENCSGAPYAGVKLVTWPLVLVNVPAIFCASDTTFAIPKSRSLTVASPRGSPRTKMLPGLMSRCATPLRCASASASAAGSSRCTASAARAKGRPRAFSSASDGLERRPLEPLEHHEGDARRAFAVEHPDVARLHDGRRARREVREERALLDELVEQLLPVRLGEVAKGLEHLERHRALPDDVHRLVDGREAALADHALDRVLIGDRATDEL